MKCEAMNTEWKLNVNSVIRREQRSRNVINASALLEISEDSLLIQNGCRRYRDHAR
jgi:hypothetical protein